mgnify:CR=1 FL=1|jgi:D-alanine transaminase
MSRCAYVNGRYVRHGSATTHIEDRGMQFSDGVYEVIAVVDGALVDAGPHHDRLERSLAALRIASPMGRAALESVLCEVVRRNRVREGIVYLQINRGVAPRNHAFPTDSRPSMVVTARRGRPATAEVLTTGVRVVTVPDIRWRRRDVKSVSLLPNVLAKQSAAEAGAFEAWQVDDDGLVTEGSQSNAWMVDADGGLVTRPASTDILSGITRMRIIELAQAAGLAVAERAFTVVEAQEAREAFLTSTSSFVVPVVQIDDAVIANGRPGAVTEQVRSLYLDRIAR